MIFSLDQGTFRPSKERMGKRWTKRRDTLPKKARAERPSSDWRGDYAPIVKENKLLESYYASFLGEEYSGFIAEMRKVLPATFRMVRLPEGNDFQRDLMQFKEMGLVEPISFVPDAWQLPVSKRELRKPTQDLEPDGIAASEARREQLEKVHKWLLAGVEAGAVCRQEAVSMLPPLLLNIDSPDLLVLDMCAAPGSKTGQLLEYLQRDVGPAGVTGMVVANDADRDRAFMLHHQVRRLLSPAVLVTNNDASMFPTVKFQLEDQDHRFERLLFDRVLCDVPCSGDGTLRKTPAIWKSWSPNQAFGLHSLQRRILARGLQSVRPGGYLVYSTCSLNPVEDEAVIAEALRKFKGEVELVEIDHASLLPGLRVSPGASQWPIMTQDGQFHHEYTEALEQQRVLRSFFPPTTNEAAWMHMERCFRVLPHHQNTGGFFIALLKRTAAFQNTNPIEHPEALAKEQEQDQLPDVVKADSAQGGKEEKRPSRFTFDRFKVLGKEANPELYYSIVKRYYPDAADPFPSKSLITRSADAEGPTPRNLLLATNVMCDVLRSQAVVLNKLKVVNCGVRGFERYEPSARHASDKYDCQYRALSELIPAAPGFRPQEVSVDDFVKLLGTDTTVKLEGVAPGDSGGMILTCSLDNKASYLSAWKTADGYVRPFISKQDRPVLFMRLKHN